MLIIRYLSYCSNHPIFGHLEFLQVPYDIPSSFFSALFLIFWLHKMCQSHCFLWSSPGIKHFSKELWFLLLENSVYHHKPRVCHRACSWLLEYLSFLLGSLRQQSWEIYIYTWLLAHTYTHLHVLVHLFLCLYIKTMNSYGYLWFQHNSMRLILLFSVYL